MSKWKDQNQNNMPDAAGAAPTTAPWFRLMGAVVLIFLGMLLLYGRALNGGFLWDDLENITKPQLRSWQGLERIWFQWGATQTYYPVLHTVYWIEDKLWDDATLGYHVASILFHSVSIVLVYLIVRRLRIPGAVLAAAIFAVHPVYVESVAWITEQKNTLSGMFYLGSLLAYLYFDDNRRRPTYALAMSLFVLSLACKTTAVTLPVALLVVLWWKRGSLSWRRDLAPLVPWFALSLLLGMFTNWYERVYVGVEGNEFVMNPIEKCLVASRAVWFYLSKLFWPTNLTLIYPRWDVNVADPWQYLYVAALLALFAGAWLVYLYCRWRAPLAALLFFVGTLLPLLGIFSTYIFRYTQVCDHFQYLPSLGIVVLVSAGIALALNRLPAMARHVGQGLCVLVLCTLAVLTWRQTSMYRDVVTLFQTIIEKNPTCWMAYNNLGLILADAGRTSEAIEYYQKALSLHPDYAEAHNNLGLELAHRGQPQEAIEHYHQALRIQSNFPAALTNLGNALSETGHPQKAIQQYEQALQINPDFSMAQFNLGNSMLSAGRLDEAIEHYRHAVRVRPEYTDAHFNLGLALVRAGKQQEALAEFEQAVRLKPDFAQAHYNLGEVLLELGRPEEALQQFRQTLHLKPDDASIYAKLMKTYAALHHDAEAIAAAHQALELARSHGDAALAKQIEDWLANYRQPQTNPQDVSPKPEPTRPASKPQG